MSLFGLFFRDQLKTPELDEFEHLTTRMSAWALREHNEDGTHNVRPSGFDFVPIGGLVMWGGAAAPTSWLICDGSQISRTTYQALFNAIGTTYGVGDGTTTFNIPDLRQRFPLGKSAAGTGATLGATGGTIDHNHTVGGITGSTASGVTSSTNTSGQSNDHTHNYSVTSGVPSAQFPANVVQGWTGGGSANPPTASHTHDSAGTTAGVNSDHTHVVPALTIPALGAGTLATGAVGSANPPYVTVNYIILSGV